MPELTPENDPSVYTVTPLGRDPITFDGTRLVVEMQEAGLVGEGASLTASKIAAIMRRIAVVRNQPVPNDWSDTELFAVASKALQHMDALGNAHGTRQTSQPATG